MTSTFGLGTGDMLACLLSALTSAPSVAPVPTSAGVVTGGPASAGRPGQDAGTRRLNSIEVIILGEEGDLLHEDWTVVARRRTARADSPASISTTAIQLTQRHWLVDPETGVAVAHHLSAGTYDVHAVHPLGGSTKDVVVELGTLAQPQFVVLRSLSPDSDRILRAHVTPTPFVLLDPSSLRAVHQRSGAVAELRRGDSMNPALSGGATTVVAIDVEPGVYRLTSVAPGFEGWQSAEFETGRESQLKVDIEARLTVALVGRQSGNRARVPITCEALTPLSGSTTERVAWTDPSGCALHRGLVPGAWRVTLELSRWSVVTRDVELVHGDQRIELEVPRTCALRVLLPMAERELQTGLFASVEARMGRIEPADAAGEDRVWKVDGLPIGTELTLEVARPRPDLGPGILGSVGSRTVSCAEEDVMEVTLDVDPDAVPGAIRLSSADGRFARGRWTVELEPQDRPGLNSLPLHRRTFSVQEGRALLTPLPEAQYAVVVRRDGQSWRSGEVVGFVAGFVPSATIDVPADAFEAPR